MTSKKKIQTNQQRVTVGVGYGLFGLTVVALALSIVPLIQSYTNQAFQNYNYTLVLVSFIFAAIAPPLVGYLAGDAATRAAYGSSRRFNGVLFGVVGVWLWAAASMYTTIFQQNISLENDFQQAILSMFPAAFAAIATIALAIFYARQTKHQVPVIDYKPYRSVLFGSVIATVLAFGVLSLFSLQYGNTILMTLLINLIVPSLFMLILLLVGYWVLGRTVGTVGERLVYCVVAMAYGLVAMSTIGQFTSYLYQWRELVTWLAFLVGLVVWLGYLIALRRTSH